MKKQKDVKKGDLILAVTRAAPSPETKSHWVRAEKLLPHPAQRNEQRNLGTWSGMEVVCQSAIDLFLRAPFSNLKALF